jgi:K+-sensing histidine kinase KdpD
VVGRLRDELERQRRSSATDELQRQNEELLRTLEELHARKAEVERLNRELEETNRGVVALYAELEEKAEALRRASDMKTRFISNVSHELRTPISSILNLSRLLLDHIDGPLNGEQEKQVLFIRKSGEALQELIDDLLDLAKIESGRVEVQPTRFSVAELFGALRGHARPLRVHEGVALVFDEPEGPSGAAHRRAQAVADAAQPRLQRAQVHPAGRGAGLRGARSPGARWCSPCSDTGVGIAPEDQERIFEEFVQVEGAPPAGREGHGAGDCPCRGGWRSCSAARSACTASQGGEHLPGDGGQRLHPASGATRGRGSRLPSRWSRTLLPMPGRCSSSTTTRSLATSSSGAGRGLAPVP